jgi:hypothetical protein
LFFLLSLTVEVRFKKNNTQWKVDYFIFVRLEKYIGLFLQDDQTL